MREKILYSFYLRFSALSAGIFHCYMQYASLKGQAGSDVTIKDLGLQTDFSVYLQIQQTWLAFSEFLHHYVFNVQNKNQYTTIKKSGVDRIL